MRPGTYATKGPDKEAVRAYAIFICLLTVLISVMAILGPGRWQNGWVVASVLIMLFVVQGGWAWFASRLAGWMHSYQMVAWNDGQERANGKRDEALMMIIGQPLHKLFGQLIVVPIETGSARYLVYSEAGGEDAVNLTLKVKTDPQVDSVLHEKWKDIRLNLRRSRSSIQEAPAMQTGLGEISFRWPLEREEKLHSLPLTVLGILAANDWRILETGNPAVLESVLDRLVLDVYMAPGQVLQLQADEPLPQLVAD